MPYPAAKPGVDMPLGIFATPSQAGLPLPISPKNKKAIFIIAINLSVIVQNLTIADKNSILMTAVNAIRPNTGGEQDGIQERIREDRAS